MTTPLLLRKDRRRPEPKPRIQKLAGTEAWLCRLPEWAPLHGIGPTPEEAYRAWKRKLSGTIDL